MSATFRHGDPLMVDHTPSSAVTAGQVIVSGNKIRIAHTDIPANTLGALAEPSGNAVYSGVIGSDEAIADGAELYWDVSESEFTATGTDNVFAGYAVAAATTAATSVDFVHANSSVTPATS